jgi:Family of unknown function (DUF5681)
VAGKGGKEKAANSQQNSKKPLPEALERNKFKPGQSGNPSGRPKKKPITELYESILNDPEQIAALRKSIIKVLDKGNMAMVLHLKEMTDRVEGKVTQPIEADITVNLADAIAAARKRAGK